MQYKLPIHTKNCIKSYSYHAFMSSILLDDKMTEPSNVWYSDLRVDSDAKEEWYEQHISVKNVGSSRQQVFLGNDGEFSYVEGDVSSLSEQDNFNYVYMQSGHETAINIKFDYIENTSVWAKVGLMFRESTSPDAKYLFIFATPSIHGLYVQKREKTGQLPSFEKLEGCSFSDPFKIEKAGEEYIIYCGDNEVSRFHNFFEREPYMGIAACSPQENAYLDWYGTNYIQLYCYKDFRMHEISIDFNVGLHKERDFYSFCPYISVQTLDYSTLQILDSNIIEVLINLINHQIYIDVDLDEFYLAGREAYNNRPYFHPNLIFGYDLSKKIFYITGFVSGNFYEKGQITFSDFEKSLHRSADSRILLLKVHPYYKFDFNPGIIRKQLVDYVDAVNSLSYLSINQNVEPNLAHGIDVYQAIIDNIPGFIDRDIRPLQVIYEHKKLMLMRLEWMYKKNILQLEDFDHFFCEYKSLEKLAFVTRNLQLKNKISPTQKNVNKIITNLISMKDAEVNILKQLIDCI